MKRFQFRMEKILKIKEHIEMEAKLKFASVMQQKNKIEIENKQMNIYIEESMETGYSVKGSNELNFFNIQLHEEYIGNLLKKIEINNLKKKVLEEKIEVFKDFQYHIVIENSCYNNYFSEKIIDCFITKTIPIYVGCPNIDFFFDISGILEADNVEDILYFCKDLTPEFYLSKKKAIETNFQLCKEYARDFTERIYETILEEIERR